MTQTSLLQYSSKSFPKIYNPSYSYEVKQLRVGMKDIYPNIIKPNKPVEPSDKYGNEILVFLILVVLFISFLIVLFIYGITLNLFVPGHTSAIRKEIWENGGRIIVLGLPIILAIIALFRFLRNGRKADKEIAESYVQQCARFQEKLTIYLEKGKEVNSKTFQDKYKRQVLRGKATKSKEDIIKNSVILSDQDVKKGISELFFHDYLVKYSDYQIYKSLKFGFYFPDIVIIDPRNNFIVDIEIDEPYAFESKEPIHYDSIDIKRDIYFTQNDFLVIRFAEEQIINHPEYCLDIIHMAINCLQTLKDLDETIISKYEVPIWNYEDAFSMAYNHTRKGIDELIQASRNRYL